MPGLYTSPVLSDKMQDPTMRDDNDMGVLAGGFHEIPEPQPRVAGARLELLRVREVPGVRGLEVPVLGEEAEVDETAAGTELLLQQLVVAADVARVQRDLLAVRQGDDLLPRPHRLRERVLAREYRPPDRRGHEVRDLGVVGKGFVKFGALLFAEVG